MFTEQDIALLSQIAAANSVPVPSGVDVNTKIIRILEGLGGTTRNGLDFNGRARLALQDWSGITLEGSMNDAVRQALESIAAGGGGSGGPTAEWASVALATEATTWLAARAADSGAVLSLVPTGISTNVPGTSDLDEQCGNVPTWASGGYVRHVAGGKGRQASEQWTQSSAEANAAMVVTGSACIRMIVVGGPSGGQFRVVNLADQGNADHRQCAALFDQNVPTPADSRVLFFYRRAGDNALVDINFTMPEAFGQGDVAYVEVRVESDGTDRTVSAYAALNGAEDLTQCALGAISPTVTDNGDETATARNGMAGTGASYVVETASNGLSRFGLCYLQVLNTVPSLSASQQVYDDLRSEIAAMS